MRGPELGSSREADEEEMVSRDIKERWNLGRLNLGRMIFGQM